MTHGWHLHMLVDWFTEYMGQIILLIIKMQETWKCLISLAIGLTDATHYVVFTVAQAPLHDNLDECFQTLKENVLWENIVNLSPKTNS